MTTDTRASALFAIRAPHYTPGLHYRAYEEKLGDGTVLGWVVARLRARAPAGATLVCICESADEKRRLTGALDVASHIEVVNVAARGERQLCRLLMEQFSVTRLILGGFSHAIGPIEMIRRMMSIHKSLNAELSELTHATFADRLLIIESSLLEEMEHVVLPNVPDTVIPAAGLLELARARERTLARDFVWVRFDIAKVSGLTPEHWPEQVMVRHSKDVEVLRRAVASQPNVDRADGLVRAWKDTAIVSESPFARTAVVAPGSKSRTRILFAAHLPGFTGAHQSILHLLGALDRRRYDLLALASYEGTFTDELRRRNITVICPDCDITAPGIDSVRFAVKLLEALKPDILHAQHFVGMGIVCAAAAAGVRFVQHVRVPNVWTIRHYVHAADAVIAVSSYIRQRLAELDVDPARVAVIPNGVDPDVFKPDPEARLSARACYGIPRDEFVVLVIARMAPKKRHDLVIKAVARLRQTIGRGHLVMVGAREANRVWPYEMQRLVEREGLAEHTTRIEFAADIRPILHSADVLALLSEEEPLSRAVLEGMAVGLPAIVSDSGGSQELIEHALTGFTVPRGNYVDLANVLVQLAGDESLRLAIGAAAAGKVRRSLTAGHCARSTEALYEAVLNGDGQAPGMPLTGGRSGLSVRA